MSFIFWHTDFRPPTQTPFVHCKKCQKFLSIVYSHTLSPKIICPPKVSFFSIIKVIPKFFMRGFSSNKPLIQRINMLEGSCKFFLKPCFPLVVSPLSFFVKTCVPHIKREQIATKKRERGHSQGEAGIYKNHKFLLSHQSCQ